MYKKDSPQLQNFQDDNMQKTTKKRKWELPTNQAVQPQAFLL